MSNDATYMSCLPASFQEMANVVLIVELVDLPAHKAILTVNSTVLADLLTTQASEVSSLKAHEPESYQQSLW